MMLMARRRQNANEKNVTTVYIDPKSNDALCTYIKGQQLMKTGDMLETGAESTNCTDAGVTLYSYLLDYRESTQSPGVDSAREGGRLANNTAALLLLDNDIDLAGLCAQRDSEVCFFTCTAIALARWKQEVPLSWDPIIFQALRFVGDDGSYPVDVAVDPGEHVGIAQSAGRAPGADADLDSVGYQRHKPWPRPANVQMLLRVTLGNVSRHLSRPMIGSSMSLRLKLLGPPFCTSYVDRRVNFSSVISSRSLRYLRATPTGQKRREILLVPRILARQLDGLNLVAESRRFAQLEQRDVVVKLALDVVRMQARFASAKGETAVDEAVAADDDDEARRVVLDEAVGRREDPIAVE
ncbi:hypothetical protein TSAR_008886 [Trichomalopsis sarcophagae]|uniref:Uncharacterized protein n=1 Tax=Trichomalopsis sarcophagae TaxID=543379 RepID=A0A232EYY9_9HYME|nr:hypothetical protein TSAR_008886 [Trichomalopsis sarcophagae]